MDTQGLENQPEQDQSVDDPQAGQTVDEWLAEKQSMDYFLSLKRTYADQRMPWEERWQQAIASVYLTDDLKTVYEGRAKIKSPIMKWKVRGIKSRINRIIFNVDPIARIEDPKIDGQRKKLVDLWNRYIFVSQLPKIEFKKLFKVNQMVKCILGTNVAKVTQEYEETTVEYFEGMENTKMVVKDNTYYRPLLLTEFYSDVNKMNPNDSDACIHSTVITLQELRANEKKQVPVEYALIDPATGQEMGRETKMEWQGIYKNLSMLTTTDGNLTIEQENYIERLGLGKKAMTEFTKLLKESEKTGYILIDECYGKYWHEDEWKECIVTIAQGRVVIRGPEPTPFKHKRYIRPFIVGRYETIQNCLYGDSNVIGGVNLLMELNAARAQVSDARTRSISPMWYMDINKDVVWDRVWRPNGLIKGNGQNGMVPLLNPYLGNVGMDDTTLIQRDMDQLWNISPIQEGTTDARMIPQTASQTTQVISQNDMPLNDIIDDTIETEIKPFLEMVYERNLTFKETTDLLDVWTEKDLAKAGIQMDENGQAMMMNEKTGQPEAFTMKMMMLEHMEIKVLGSLELSNEVARQSGIVGFLMLAERIPSITARLDWKKISDILLASYGIKDLEHMIWLDEEVVQQVMAEQSQKEAQDQQSQGNAQMQAEQMKLQGKQAEMAIKVQGDSQMKQMDMQHDMMVKQAEIQAHKIKVNTETEADLVKMQAQATIENTTRARI